MSEKTKVKFFLLVCIISSVLGCSSQVTEKVDEKVKSEKVEKSIGFDLITLEDQKNPSIDDPRINAIDSKIDNIANETGIDSHKIAAMLVSIKNQLKERGKTTSIWEIIEVAHQSVQDKAYPLNNEKTLEGLASYLTSYVISRDLQNHSDSLLGLKGMYDVINDPQKIKQLENAVNNLK